MALQASIPFIHNTEVRNKVKRTLSILKVSSVNLRNLIFTQTYLLFPLNIYYYFGTFI
jgi:hypothetical protein